MSVYWMSTRSAISRTLNGLPPYSGISESTIVTSAPRSTSARRQVRADEPEPAGDERPPALELVRVHRLGSSIQAAPARPAFSRRTSWVGSVSSSKRPLVRHHPARIGRRPGPAAPELAGHHPRAEGDVREEEDAAIREAPQHVAPGLVVELGVDAVEQVELGVERLLAAEVVKMDVGVGEVLTQPLDRARRDVGEHQLDVRDQSPQPGLDDPGADPVGRDASPPPPRRSSPPARAPGAPASRSPRRGARTSSGSPGKRKIPSPWTRRLSQSSGPSRSPPSRCRSGPKS